ncbi:MAG: hypothetical protein ICV74_08060 [Thermoleophilia bacterium]|nr:hypothetical protein [Thermoleophilia bacterium]
MDWVRLLATPFVLAEPAFEDYPPADARFAWALAATFTLAAGSFFAAGRRGRPRALGAAALAFDTVFLSCWAVLYAYDPGTPARDLLVLVPVEAALRYGRLGALAAAATVPALALFEWRLTETLDAPYQPGHAVFPAGLYLLVGLLVGVLRDRTA